ncbi:MAG: transporter ATP-binding protein, partial [Phycisphaerales bacterium]|nr:transporter ATP-binding protein [Phycisphaerales bacterium]
AAIGLVLKAGQDLLGVAQSVLSNRVNYNGLLRVRCDLYRKLQALDLDYHRSRPQGDAIHRLSSDTFGFQAILGTVVATVVAVATFAAMAVVLGSRSPALTAIALSVAPPLAIANVVFGRRLKARSIECKERDAEFTSAVQQSIASVGLMQAFGREAHEFARFQGTVRETIRSWWRLNRQQMAYTLIIGMLFGAAGAAVFGYGGYLVYRDQFLRPRPGGMTVGDLMVFTSYLGMIWGPLCTLTGFAANAHGGAAGAERVFEVLDRNPAVADRLDAVPLPVRPRTLEFEHVGFEYPVAGPRASANAEGNSGPDEEDSSRGVLRDVSVRVRPGESVAFVGASGAGKSTLLNLIPRFYDPTAGTIRLDGVDARAVKVEDLRRHVALVLQDSALLPSTVAENIAYGRPGASREEVREAARMAGAAEFIERLPGGYACPVAEGGANLSGGQRQRLNIARALLTGAPIVVLDEPTSALDPHHEHFVTESLRGLKGARTVVIVSHRLSSVVHCDRIYVMDGGRIVEEGTHEQLVARRGLYHSMAALQMLPDAVAGHGGGQVRAA